jgi:LysM repeat protein
MFSPLDPVGVTMSLSVARIGCLALLVLAGCGSPPPPAAAPEPEPEPEISAEPAPAAVPEIPVEERIRAPFAVQSQGRTAPRTPRNDLVILDRAPSPAAATAPRDTAAPATAAAQRPAPAAAGTATPGRTAPATGAAAGGSGTAARPAAPRQHTVEVGETFFGIARRYGVTPSALTAVNPGIDSDRLRAGQVLQLPAYAGRPTEGGAPAATPAPARPAPTGAAPAPRPAQQTAQRPAQQRTHRVASGETLWSIARRYNVTTEQIRAANRLTSDTVRIGQTLVIP